MYTKTNWVDNTTPIDKTNLNKIEQGIYDNSLVVEAVTDTINPTDTETYKTAELTEGQITDVIGVSDIVIKGQTSQDGEPTPSAPVDVNVVSGSNVINTSSKNLFDGILENSGFQATGLNAEGNTKRIRSKNYIRVKENQTYTINITEYKTTKGTISIGISYYNKNDYSTARLSESGWKNLPYTFITPENCKFIRFLCKITSSSGESEIVYTDVNKVQLEQSSAVTTYEPHQGKELSLDLPVENLLNLTDGTYSHNGITADVNKGIITLNGTASGTSAINIPISLTIKANQAYTLEANNLSVIGQSGTGGTYSCIRFRTSNTDDATSDVRFNPINNYTTFQKTEETTYAYLRIRTGDGLTYNNFIIKPQLELGSKKNAYTPYGTDPIELCKIGNYQDYFYKSGSKWYLHKEIEKRVLNGSEEWTLRGGSRFSVDIPSADGDFISTGLSNQYKFIENWDTHIATNYSFTVRNGTWGVNKARISLINTDYNNVNAWKSYLSNNNIVVYYQKISQLGGVTNTEITDTTLISQLEAIYNAPLYEETNITQTNNDLSMILDITACKDNINGIKAFIRK